MSDQKDPGFSSNGAISLSTVMLIIGIAMCIKTCSEIRSKPDELRAWQRESLRLSAASLLSSGPWEMNFHHKEDTVLVKRKPIKKLRAIVSNPIDGGITQDTVVDTMPPTGFRILFFDSLSGTMHDTSILNPESHVWPPGTIGRYLSVPQSDTVPRQITMCCDTVQGKLRTYIMPGYRVVREHIALGYYLDSNKTRIPDEKIFPYY